MSLPCWEGHVCSARELTRMTKTLSKKPQTGMMWGHRVAGSGQGHKPDWLCCDPLSFKLLCGAWRAGAVDTEPAPGR